MSQELLVLHVASVSMCSQLLLSHSFHPAASLSPQHESDVIESSLVVLYFEKHLGADVQHDRPVTNQTSGVLPAGVIGVLAHPAASSVAPPTHVVMPVPAPAAMTGPLLPSLPLPSPCLLPPQPSQPPSLCSMTGVMLTPCLLPIR